MGLLERMIADGLIDQEGDVLHLTMLVGLVESRRLGLSRHATR